MACSKLARVGLAAAALAVAATVTANPTVQAVPTERGHYQVLLRPVPPSPPLAQLHNWIVRITDHTGAPVIPTQLGITGGMPGHGHGLVSQPRVTQHLGGGEFLIEGMKFHMGGQWQLVVGINGPAGFDRALFELTLGAGSVSETADEDSWSAAQLALLESLSLDALSDPTDPSNRFSGNPQAAALGERLFFDAKLSATGKIACSSCHDPARKFTDGRRVSVGSKPTQRHSPSLLGIAHGDWFYWDGRRDSLWAQAITPIETPGEMDSTRVDAVRYVFEHHAQLYEQLTPRFALGLDRFPAGAGPFADAAGKAAWNKMQPADRIAINRAYATIGKALAAYLERLVPSRSRFDAFVSALTAGDDKRADQLLSADELAGLKLFLDGGRTQCLRCHNGPLLTNHSFHNIATGVAEDGSADFGRMIGLQAALVDEFNCRGEYSDQPKQTCAALRFADPGHAAQGAFKVPGLRNVAVTAPYLHDGRLASLREVVALYTHTPAPEVGPHELPPLTLSDAEIDQLTAFLGTLTGIVPDPRSATH